MKYDKHVSTGRAACGTGIFGAITDMARERSVTRVLNIYVARHCFGAAEAMRLAENARQKLPGIEVKVTMAEDIPATDMLDIPATPAYLLDGRLLFLGNPRLDELVAKIALCSSTEGREDG